MSLSANISVDGIDVAASRWTADHIAAIALKPLPQAPLIGAIDAEPLLPEHDLWDLWPVQNPDGSVAAFSGGELWMVLSAPRLADPNMRHDVARIRLLFRRDGLWRDCGLLFPDELNPGAREWSGSARYDAAHGAITTFFTASGRRGEVPLSFEQRLFRTTGLLDLSGDVPIISDWSVARQIALNDGNHYVDLRLDQGVPGNIKGFRDPFWFRNPADGLAYIIFTGSQAGSIYSHNGVVGLARARNADGEENFDLLRPLISADGVCNEMERPHLFIRDGLYYLFWSSQNSVFAPDGPKGPSGLYGMVGQSMFGPYEPLNGSGLVIANPAAEPRQAYCWQVLDTLEVYSFIDHWGLNGCDICADPVLRRQQFGGTIAPVLKIAIDGKKTRLLGTA